MSLLKVALLSCLVLSSAFADTVTQEFSNFKQEDIQSNDILPMQKTLKKITGTDIEVSVDWNSFKKTGYNASQELGADIQMLPQVFTKLMEDKDASELVKTKIK